MRIEQFRPELTEEDDEADEELIRWVERRIRAGQEKPMRDTLRQDEAGALSKYGIDEVIEDE